MCFGNISLRERGAARCAHTGASTWRSPRAEKQGESGQKRTSGCPRNVEPERTPRGPWREEGRWSLLGLTCHCYFKRNAEESLFWARFKVNRCCGSVWLTMKKLGKPCCVDYYSFPFNCVLVVVAEKYTRVCEFIQTVRVEDEIRTEYVCMCAAGTVKNVWHMTQL